MQTIIFKKDNESYQIQMQIQIHSPKRCVLTFQHYCCKNCGLDYLCNVSYTQVFLYHVFYIEFSNGTVVNSCFSGVK
jgi:hypothetical protein